MLSETFFDLEHSFAEYFQLGSQRNNHPVKNGLKGDCSSFFHTSRLLMVWWPWLWPAEVKCQVWFYEEERGPFCVCFGYDYTSRVAGVLGYSSRPQSSRQPARQRLVLHFHLCPLGAATGAQRADHSLQPDLLRGGLHGRRGSDGHRDELRSSEVSFVLPGRSALSSCLLVTLLVFVGPTQCIWSGGLEWLFFPAVWKGTRLGALVQNKHTKEWIKPWKMLHKHNSEDLSLSVTLAWRVRKCKVHKLHQRYIQVRAAVG